MFSELWVIYYKNSEASGILGIFILFWFSIYLFFKEPDPLAI